MPWLSISCPRSECSTTDSPGLHTGADSCLITTSRAVPLGSYPIRELAERIGPGPFCVLAADGGAVIALELGLVPDAVIGDMDSLPPAVKAGFSASSKMEMHPVHKDRTDAHLALDRALADGWRDITIVIDRRGRMDHVQSVLWLACDRAGAGARIRLADSEFEAAIVRGPACVDISGRPGLIVSLLAFGRVSGIALDGMRYRLDDEDLHQGESRGISNVVLGTDARVRWREGTLVVMVTSVDR